MNARKGITLIEIVAALSIMGLVSLLVGPLITVAYRSFEVAAAQAQLQSEVFLAVRDIVKTVERGGCPDEIAAISGIDDGLEIDASGLQLFVVVMTNWTGYPAGVPQPADFTNPDNYTIYRYGWDIVGEPVELLQRFSCGGASIPTGEDKFGIRVARGVQAVRFVKDTAVRNKVTITATADPVTVAGRTLTASYSTSAQLRGRRAGL